MELNTDSLRKFFKSDRWMWLLGLTLALILAVVIHSQRAPHRNNLPQSEPTITVFFHETGQIREMPLETYLEGVVAAEMNPNWPLSALEAQAIAARTFTLKKMESGPIPGRNTDASTLPEEFQAYDAGKINDNVRQAVNNTRGQIITHAGMPINAWFHASSGGKTASAAEGLGFRQEPTPYVTPVSDVQTEPTHTWTATFPASEIIRALNNQGVQVDSISSIKIGRTGPSGRAETLIINDKEVSAPALRLTLGGERMRSTLLDYINLDNSTVVMRGKGWGHGVGMSQWGAWLLAQRGNSAKDIILYYYRGVKVTDLW